MSFTIFNGNTLNQLIGRTFDTESYFFDDNLSLQELIGKAIYRLNEGIIEINSMEQAITAFETYVLDELSLYDAKIITDVTTILNNYIADGTITNLINQSIFQGINSSITQLQADKLTLQNEIDLINYKEPSVTLSSSPSQLLYNVGENINSIVLTFNVTKGTNNLSKAEIYKNNALITTINNIIEGNNIYTDANIVNSDTEYYIKLYDDKNNLSSNKVTYNFVYNYYYGLIGANDSLNSSLITSLTSFKTLKEDFKNNFSPVNQRIVLAYPASYGELADIEEINGNLIEGFTKQTITINTINYYVYVSNFALTFTNEYISFNF